MDVYYSVKILSATSTIRIKQSLNMFCWKSDSKRVSIKQCKKQLTYYKCHQYCISRGRLHPLQLLKINITMKFRDVWNQTLSKINQLSLMHSCAFNWRLEMCKSTASLGLWHESNIYSNDFHSSCTSLTQTSVISMHYIIPSEGTLLWESWWLYF